MGLGRRRNPERKLIVLARPSINLPDRLIDCTCPILLRSVPVADAATDIDIG